MPGASKDDAPITVDAPEYEFRRVELGEYTLVFETFKADAEPGDAFRGLPDDRCPCPHWGYVVAGRVIHRYADRDETFEAGDAYYAPPGHLPIVFAGTQLVQFSPTDELASVQAVVEANLRGAAGE